MNRTHLRAGSLAALLVSAGLGPVALPASAQEPPPEVVVDPAVVAARAEAAAAPGTPSTGPDPAPVVNPPTSPEAGTSGAIGKKCAGPGEDCHHSAIGRAFLPEAGTYIRAEIPDDYAKNDPPGFLTTTLRIWGTDWGQTESGRVIDEINHRDQMTCTGIGISGVSVGMSGSSVSGGATSSTVTAEARRTITWYLQRYYTGDAHWRCKGSNASGVKVTRRLVADGGHKGGTTAPQASYDFWF